MIQWKDFLVVVYQSLYWSLGTKLYYGPNKATCPQSFKGPCFSVSRYSDQILLAAKTQMDVCSASFTMPDLVTSGQMTKNH